MYQRLLHLIHIPTFFGILLLFELNSYFSPTFFYRFLPVLLFTCPTYWTPKHIGQFSNTNDSYQRILVVLICIWCIVLLIIITIFFTKRSWLSRCTVSQGVYIKNRQYFKFVMFLSKEVEIDMNFYMKKEFCKNFDYFLRYFAICEQIFPTFSYIIQHNYYFCTQWVN